MMADLETGGAAAPAAQPSADNPSSVGQADGAASNSFAEPLPLPWPELPQPKPKPKPKVLCRHCGKPPEVCVCDKLSPVALGHRVLVLQHPQEADHLLGTVPLLQRGLGKIDVRVGLSWASLNHALQRTVVRERWALVFPGSGQQEGDVAASPAKKPGGKPSEKLSFAAARAAQRAAMARAKVAAASSDTALARLEGIILLDGTWSQAKTLLYRNPWLRRLSRLSLGEGTPSIYGRLRREPRRGHVSTLEAAVAALVRLGEPAAALGGLLRALRTLAQRLRDANARAQKAARPRRGKAQPGSASQLESASQPQP